MLKLLTSALFGIDMRNSLIIYLILTPFCYLCGADMLPWPWWALFGIAITCFFGLLPDLDLIHYRLVVKGKLTLLTWLSAILMMVLFGVGVWLKSTVFLFLIFGVALMAWSAIKNKDMVIARGSHWPIAHYPVLVVICTIVVVAVFAWQYTPGSLWYLESLAVSAVIAHFLHDARNAHGFPLFSVASQRMCNHWHMVDVIPPVFSRVPVQFTRRFYDNQGARLKSQTAVEDLQRRADKVGIKDVVTTSALLLAACVYSFVFSFF